MGRRKSEENDDVVTEAEQEKMEAQKSEIAENCSAISDYALKEIGRAANLLRIHTVHLYKNRYRVNYWLTSERGPYIAHSYFVKYVPDGVICQPELKLLYPKKAAL